MAKKRFRWWHIFGMVRDINDLLERWPKIEDRVKTIFDQHREDPELHGFYVDAKMLIERF